MSGLTDTAFEPKDAGWSWLPTIEDAKENGVVETGLLNGVGKAGLEVKPDWKGFVD